MAEKSRLNPSRSKSRDQLLAELDERLRLNRGQFTTLASDTGSNTPFLLRQGREVIEDPTGLGYQNPGINFDIPQAPSLQMPESVEYEYEQDFGSDALPENPSAQQMLQAIFNAAWEPSLPSTEQLEVLYQQTGQAYPIRSLDNGMIEYNDGSVRQSQNETPMPIASMHNGTILWSDGFVRERPAQGLASYLAGVSGLSQLIFGREQTVTQRYGNYNPQLEPGSGYNYGTDFRTRDLQNRNLIAPVAFRVVQILHDDGTRWGTESGHQGYGNSVLLELPSGEMLRLSHLSSLGNFQVGQVLNPGELIGIPGATGNTAGEHLDVEYYNAQGELDNPNNFKVNAETYSIGNEIVGVSPYVKNQSRIDEERPNQSFAQDERRRSNFLDPVRQKVDEVTERVSEFPERAAEQIQSANPTGQYGLGLAYGLQGNEPAARRQRLITSDALARKTGDVLGVDTELGISEGLITPEAKQARAETVATGRAGQTNPNRYLLGNTVEAVGDAMGWKEGSGSELIAGTQTRRTNVANASDGNMLSLPSSPYQGDKYQQNLLGDAQRAYDYNIQQTGDFFGSLGKQAGAAVDRFSSGVKQAGEGIRDVAQSGLDSIGNIFRSPSAADIGERRVVGEQSANSDPGILMSKSSLVNTKDFSPATNDIRDNFFKEGKDEQYRDYIRETPADGALSLGVFSDEFFQDPGRIADVFSDTYMGKAATDKFRSYIQSKYGNENKYDQGEVSRLLSSIPSVIQGGFSYQKPTKKIPTLKEYLARGKTVAQYYAETGQQKTLDKAQKAGYDPSTNKDFSSATGFVNGKPVKTSNPYNDYGKQMSVGPKQGVTNAIRAAAAGKTYISPSGNAIKNYTPAKANMTDASTGLPVVAKKSAPRSSSKSNIFSRKADDIIKNIFRL